MRRKLLLFTFVSVLLLASMFSLANATTPCRTISAVGAGVFIHDHEGIPHTHYFAFSVSDKNAPSGTFDLVCRHDGQIDTIIISTKITSLSVMAIQGGSEAVFSGSAMVKLDGAAWTKGWTFTVTAFDLGGRGADLIGVTLVTPQGQVQCSADPTSLASGNIIIRM